MTNKNINVRIINKGSDVINVSDTDTISNLKRLLSLDDDVQAYSATKQVLNDDTTLESHDSVFFSPKVVGGLD